MTIPPPKPGSANRVALAARLVELRVAAGLSGLKLAERMKIVQSRVWKIEHPLSKDGLVPTEEDIALWVRETGRPEVVEELTAMMRAARNEQKFATLYRQKGGAAAYEDRVRGIEYHSQRIGEFEVAVIPGLLQTEDYCREVVSLPGGLKAWGMSDAEIRAKIDGRLRRQQIVLDPEKQIQMVLGEAALRTRVVAPDVLVEQLGKLQSLLRLPAVELGVIPFNQHVPAYTLGGFRVYDEDLITVESIAGETDFTADKDADTVAAFLDAFKALRAAASTGDAARAIIAAAAADLRS